MFWFVAEWLEEVDGLQCAHFPRILLVEVGTDTQHQLRDWNDESAWCEGLLVVVVQKLQNTYEGVYDVEQGIDARFLFFKFGIS